MGRGSTWNIWDFHLHTPCSILNNQFGNPEDDETWERYIDAVEAKAAEAEIAAIGVTDYFTIEGYKRVRQYQEDGRLQNLLIFPNVEFRVGPIIDGRRLNYHVLFSPKVTVNEIEEHFLHDLNFVHEEETFEGASLRKLKLSNLEEFGEMLREQHRPFRGNSALKVGCMNAKVKLDEIKQRLLNDGRFSGKYLLVLADEDLSRVDWDGQDHGTRKQLIQMSHAIFASNRGSREFYLGQRHDTPEEYIEEFKTFKPCIWGCDSHSYDERFLEPDGERYCWVKSEVSWEGLRQVLYEPQDRIRIQTDNPEPSKSYFTLDSVQVDETKVNEALAIDNLDIELNPNLVAIIGGRGSGKTALLDLIAACFPEGKKLAKLKNSFYHRLYSAGRSRAPGAQPVPVSLRFRSRDVFPKQVGQEEKVFEQSDVLYLTQNHMDEYTANPDNLVDHIVDLVFEQIPDSRQDYDELHEQAREISREIQSLNLEIDQLGREVESKLGEEQEKLTQKQGDLADYKKRLEEQDTQQTESAEATSRLTDRLRSLKVQRDKMIALRELLEALSTNIEKFYAQYEVDASAINERIVALSDLSDLSPLPVELGELEGVTQTLLANVKVLETAQPNAEEEIVVVDEQLSALEGIDHTIAKLRRTIDSITTEIEGINERIENLEKKEERVLMLDSQRRQKYAQMMQKTMEQRLYLQSIIDQFEIEQDDLLAGLSFSAVVDTSIRDAYVERLAEKVDGRSHSLDAISRDLGDVFERAHEQLNTPNPPDDPDDTSALLPMVEQLREWAEGVRLRQSTAESEFFNALFSPFFRIGLDIEFNNRPLEALSMGERAIVLLKILLGLDDKPLLIDQPEEHLDNRYIYDELVPAFRSAKAKRQIIIATHNANLVVNTDAEQIIVAEHSNGTLSYQVGSLEDLNIRESITTILEGGDQAFKKREEKYGYLF